MIVDAECENTCLEIGEVFFCYVLLPSSGENPDRERWRVLVATPTKKEHKLQMCQLFVIQGSSLILYFFSSLFFFCKHSASRLKFT